MAGKWVTVAIALVLSLAPGTAAALALLDFASSSGRFSIAAGQLDFGSDLLISAARDNADVPDASVLGFGIEIDPLQLTGVSSPLGFGITTFEIDLSFSYQLAVRDPGTGNVLLRGDLDPGQFLVVFSSGLVSPASGPGLSNVVFDPDGLGLSPLAYPSLAAFASSSGGIDFNATLSGAGQDFAAQIQAGLPVQGSAAGSLVVLSDPEKPVPEPAAALLLSLGLAGWLWRGRRDGWDRE